MITIILMIIIILMITIIEITLRCTQCQDRIRFKLLSPVAHNRRDISEKLIQMPASVFVEQKFLNTHRNYSTK